jgi:hypothetical protein
LADYSFDDAIRCAIRSRDESLVCWWGGDQHEMAPGIALSEVAIGFNLICAVRADTHAIVCFAPGYEELPEDIIQVPPSSGAYHHVQVIGSLTCAIREDNAHVECWGTDSGGETPPADLQLRTMSLVRSSGCGLGLDNEVHCWPNPELKRGAPAGVQFSQIDLGAGGVGVAALGPTFGVHVCGLRAYDGRVMCWGDDSLGQVSGAPNRRAYRSVGMTGSQACALDHKGHALCWGPDAPLPYAATYDQVTGHCGLRADDAHVECTSQVTSSLTGAYAYLSEASTGLCGIRAADHQVDCSGSDEYGQIRLIPKGVQFSTVSVGNAAVCAIREQDSIVQCWGDPFCLSAQDAPSGLAALQLGMKRGGAFDSACVVRAADSQIQCWGTNAGDRPEFRKRYAHLSEHTSCAILSDTGAVTCFETELQQYDRVQAPQGRFSTVESDGLVACAIRASDQVLTCWGRVIWNPL